MPLYVIAKLRATDLAPLDTIAGELAALEQVTVTEPGCLRFEVRQSTGEPAVFFLLESWHDQAALDTHLNASYTRDFLGLGYVELAEHHVVTPASEH